LLQIIAKFRNRNSKYIKLFYHTGKNTLSHIAATLHNRDPKWNK